MVDYTRMTVTPSQRGQVSVVTSWWELGRDGARPDEVNDRVFRAGRGPVAWL